MVAFALLVQLKEGLLRLSANTLIAPSSASQLADQLGFETGEQLDAPGPFYDLGQPSVGSGLHFYARVFGNNGLARAGGQLVFRVAGHQ